MKAHLPIKAIPESELNTIILTTFLTWLADILSLTDEVSAKRLKTALPAIKKHCWSMGFAEIKKMFEMYVDFQLGIKPIPNYFDRILFGKIVEAYKQQKQKPKKIIEPMVISDEDKRNNEIMSATICFDYYVQNGYLNETSGYLYKLLLDKGLFNFSTKEEQTMIDLAKNLDQPIEKQRTHYKKMCLRRYFDRLHAKGMHLKDFV